MKLLKVRNKLHSDIIWSFGGFGVVALLGIGINFLIISLYSIEMLGVFNQHYALYIGLSQFAVFGVHLAVLKYIPEKNGSIAQIGAIYGSAMTFVFFLASICVIIGFLFRDVPSNVLGSPLLAKGVDVLFPAVILFALNKVSLAVLNGLRMMKAFSLLQAGRFVFMFLTVIVFHYLEINGEYLVGVFLISEALLFILSTIFLISILKYNVLVDKKVLKQIVQFGRKAFIGNFLLDINTRIDVLSIGVFMSDSAVGIYSTAASFADGFAQIPIILRNNVNPLISNVLNKRRLPDLFIRIKGNLVKKFYYIIGLFGVVSIACYPIILNLFNLMDELSVSWLVYTILTLGVVLVGGYLPFQMIFNQSGKPRLQTLYTAGYVSVNVMLNLALIPLMGISGAAIATSISVLFQAFFLKWLAAKYLAIKL